MRRRRRQTRSEQRRSQFGVIPPEPPVTVYEPCPAPIRQQDELYCPRCSTRWETGEDKPQCPQGSR